MNRLVVLECVFGENSLVMGLHILESPFRHIPPPSKQILCHEYKIAASIGEFGRLKY